MRAETKRKSVRCWKRGLKSLTEKSVWKKEKRENEREWSI